MAGAGKIKTILNSRKKFIGIFFVTLRLEAHNAPYLNTL